MNLKLASLIGLAVQAIEDGKRTVAVIREILHRDSPTDLAEFDARVAAARKPSQEAADAAARENAEGTVEEPTNGDA